MAPKRETKPKAEKPAKKVKDPNAPKRPLSGYMYFASDKRKELKETDPKLTLGEIGKATGEAWKSLTDKDKEPYMKMAEKDKVRYEKDKAAYGDGGAGGSKKEAPKKAAAKKKPAKREVEEEEEESEEEEAAAKEESEDDESDE